MTHSDTTPRLPARADHRCPVQWAALVVGLVFLLVGAAGFVPGLTEHFDEIEFAGHESGAELLGIFQVSVLHNLVHLLFGVVGILAARHPRPATNYLVVGGVIYVLLFLFGLVVDGDDDANFIPVNDADDWLHLGLGVGMIVLGTALRRHRHGYHEPSAAELNERVRGVNR